MSKDPRTWSVERLRETIEGLKGKLRRQLEEGLASPVEPKSAQARAWREWAVSALAALNAGELPPPPPARGKAKGKGAS